MVSLSMAQLARIVNKESKTEFILLESAGMEVTG